MSKQIIMAKRNLGEVLAPNTPDFPKASGTEQESEAGTYKLFVGTGCAWHVKVLNNVSSTTSTLPSGIGIE
jgi:hypothetical protein